MSNLHFCLWLRQAEKECFVVSSTQRCFVLDMASTKKTDWGKLFYIFLCLRGWLMSGLLRRLQWYSDEMEDPIRTIVDCASYKKTYIHCYKLPLIKYFKPFSPLQDTSKLRKHWQVAQCWWINNPASEIPLVCERDLFSRPSRFCDWDDSNWRIDWEFLRTEPKFSCPPLTPDPITFFDFHTCSSMSHHSRITLFSSHKSLCLFRHSCASLYSQGGRIAIQHWQFLPFCPIIWRGYRSRFAFEKIEHQIAE